MQTLTIDIINSKAVGLLHELELLQLIRVRKEKTEPASIKWNTKFKGAMSKQPISEVESQLNELRDGWE
jgi:hypothetical protein